MHRYVTYMFCFLPPSPLHGGRLCLHVYVTEELPSCFSFVGTSCSGTEQSRPLPVLGGASHAELSAHSGAVTLDASFLNKRFDTERVMIVLFRFYSLVLYVRIQLAIKISSKKKGQHGNVEMLES